MNETLYDYSVVFSSKAISDESVVVVLQATSMEDAKICAQEIVKKLSAKLPGEWELVSVKPVLNYKYPSAGVT